MLVSHIASTSGPRVHLELDVDDRLYHAQVALLVDDEELVRASTSEMLVELGYTVVEANSAEEALSLVNSGLTPDRRLTATFQT